MTDQPQLTAIQQAEKLKGDIEAERIALQREREALAAERILGGGTPAGSQGEPKKEISARDYARAADKGIILN